MTFRIRVALEFLQYLDNHEPQRFDFCIECTPTDSLYQFISSPGKKNVYLRRNKHLSKWCVSKVFQYIYTIRGTPRNITIKELIVNNIKRLKIIPFIIYFSSPEPKMSEIVLKGKLN